MISISEALAASAIDNHAIHCPFSRARIHSRECLCGGSGKMIACAKCGGSGWNGNENRACIKCSGRGAFPVKEEREA